MNERKPLYDLAYDETFDCVQCGYCLPACPTYMTMEKETHSPRGRINLVKMAAEGTIALEDIREPMELCLGCRACETVCPTDVQYGSILSSAMNALTDEKKRNASTFQQKVRQWFFKNTLTNDTTLSLLNTGLRLYQTTSLDRLARTLRLTHILPEPFTQLERVTPHVRKPKKRKSAVAPTTKPTIGFFTGCVMDTFFAHVNDWAIELLELAGYDVVTIPKQQCCGALQHHAGERELAVNLAKQNIQAFEAYSFDYIVNAIGGCGAALVEYPSYFEPDDPWHERAVQFSSKNKDVSVLLDDVPLPFVQPIERTVTYQPSCHLRNVQHVIEQPPRLIQRIPGVTYVTMKDEAMCCGSGGIYNIVHYEESMDVLDYKMDRVAEVQPDIIVTTNPGCHLQMALGVEKRDQPIEVMHLVELLAIACGLTSFKNKKE